jgi:Flp pilus assembly protein TadD
VKVSATGWVNLLVGFALSLGMVLSSCASHDKAVRKFDYDVDSKKIIQFEESAAQKNRAASAVVPPADLTAAEYERLGDIYLGKGDPINTFTHYEKSLQKDPHNTRIHYKKGLLFLIEGMNNDAIASFDKVLEKEPGNALAHRGLGQAYFQLKQNDKAKEHLLKAVSLDNSLWNAHNLLGIINDSEKNHQLAIAEYEKALETKKNNGIVHNNMGLSYAMAGNYQGAIDSYNRAIREGYTDNKVFNNLGFALFMTGKKREAFEAFKKGGDEAQAFNNLGSMYLVAGDHEKAKKCFEDAIVLKPAFYETANENLKKCTIGNLNDLSRSFEPRPADIAVPAPLRTEDISGQSAVKNEAQPYTVREGDTPFSIAKQHNMDLSDFLTLNHLELTSSIYKDKMVLVRPQ